MQKRISDLSYEEASKLIGRQVAVFSSKTATRLWYIGHITHVNQGYPQFVHEPEFKLIRNPEGFTVRVERQYLDPQKKLFAQKHNMLGWTAAWKDCKHIVVFMPEAPGMPHDEETIPAAGSRAEVA